MIPHAQVTAVSLEFGTYPPKEVLLALRAENWLAQKGKKDSSGAEEIKQELLKVFYPNTDQWNQMIWESGRRILGLAISAL